MHDISIVIPSYNSEKTIMRCLRSVFDQKTDLTYEVIVADSSTDKTPDLIKEHFPNVNLIHSDKRMYIGKARNTGIKKANSDIIICLDSDCVVADNDWLDKFFEAHKKHDIIGARISNGNPWQIFGWSLFFIEFSEFLRKQRKVSKIFLGYNVSYKKKILEKYGYFIGHKYINEDLLFNSRIHEPLFFDGNIRVKHINRTNPFKIFKYCFLIGLGSGMARKQQPQLEGHFLFTYPFLIPLLYFYRYLRAGYRTLGTWYLPVFIIVSPIILIDLIPYTVGFMSAYFKK